MKNFDFEHMVKVMDKSDEMKPFNQTNQDEEKHKALNKKELFKTVQLELIDLLNKTDAEKLKNNAASVDVEIRNKLDDVINYLIELRINNTLPQGPTNSMIDKLNDVISHHIKETI